MTLNTRFALLMVLAGLAAAAYAQAPASSTPPAAKTRLAFVTNNHSDYWTICRKGTEAAARDLGNVDVQFMMPDNGTAPTQKQDIGTGLPPRPTDYAAHRQGGRADRARPRPGNPGRPARVPCHHPRG